jgi:hypothetical protein
VPSFPHSGTENKSETCFVNETSCHISFVYYIYIHTYITMIELYFKWGTAPSDPIGEPPLTIICFFTFSNCINSQRITLRINQLDVCVYAGLYRTNFLVRRIVTVSSNCFNSVFFFFTEASNYFYLDQHNLKYLYVQQKQDWKGVLIGVH